MRSDDTLETLSDKLQAALSELVRCQERAINYRSESDTLLKGIATLARAQTLEAVLTSLIRVLQPFIGFEGASVLSVGADHCTPLSLGQDEAVPLCWPKARAFERALSGETLLLFEPSLLPEFEPVAADPRWRCVLLSGLSAPGFEGVLLCRHSAPGGLDLKSKAALQRCHPLISQALVNIAYRSRLQEQVRLQTQALHTSEQRFRSFANMASDWFWESDAEHRFRYISTPSKEAAMSAQDLVGRAMLELPLHLEGELALSQVLARQAPVRALRIAVPRYQGEQWFEVNADPSMDSNGAFSGYRGTARDIGVQIRREQELARARDSAQAASQAKSRFLAMMTHEIRSPMNAVLGMLDLLQDAPLEEQQQTLLGYATHSAKLLQTIIDDVLDFSKIESGTLTIKTEERLIRPLCDAVLEPWRQSCREKGVTLSLAVAERVPERLMIDPVRFSQIVGNLVGNAIKFTEQGEISVRLDWIETRLRVEVCDTGLGIAKRDLAHLFEPFVQGDNSASRHFGGSGLGLAICKRVLLHMKGEIGVDSTLGQGSRFWFELPDLALPGAAGDRKTPQESEILPLEVLVVEDSKVNQLVVSLMLQKLVREVRLCDSGSAALDAVAERSPDLILMDMRMPGMDGLEATRCLRQQGYDGVIVALTANAMSEDKAHCFAAGMDDFLAKPVNLSQLRRCLLKHAASSPP